MAYEFTGGFYIQVYEVTLGVTIMMITLSADTIDRSVTDVFVMCFLGGHLKLWLNATIIC